jgi:hypothetical protein
LASASAAGATSTVPYADTNAVGYIGLCNQAGQQITSGSVSTTPFAWRAVSSQAASAPYNGAGGTASLDAYLPMQSLAPGDWSGEQLTASTRYSNPQSPMAQATTKDVPLQVFLQDYPPQWNGFVQLRLFLGAPNEPADVQHYPALNLQISGGTWTAIGGGPVNCNAGTAESLETVLAPPSTTTTVAASGLATSGTTTTTPNASTASAKAQPATAKATSGSSKSAAGSVAIAQPQSWTHSGVSYFLALVVVLGFITLPFLIVARRRRAQHPSSIAGRTSVKGPQP